jgi:nicotinamidase-related amidase
MSIAVARDPKTDHLLSPENSALVLIDYQPGLVDGTFSIEHDVLVNNVVAMAKAAKMYKLPVVLSTVGVTAGFQQDTIPELKDILSGVDTIDRDTVDAWDSPDFRSAIEATGRRKIIMAALWTEVCLVYPALDMLLEGYEIYALSDVSGGTTIDAHERGMQRLIQAGAVPVTWEAVMAELGRLGSYDVNGFVDIMTEHLPKSVPTS